MKVIKNINNNVSLCVDSKGRECIAFGKGIGFIKPPYEVPLAQVERTFYSRTHIDYEGIRDVPEQIIRLAIHIVDQAERALNVTLMSTTALALADHIQFALQRMNEQIPLKLPMQEDMKQLYPREMKQAQQALDMIEEELNVQLDPKEAPMIALHFINSQVRTSADSEEKSKRLIECSVHMIEEEYGFPINRESFNYSRFVTHMDYLIRRASANNQIESVNAAMFDALKKEYPGAYRCAQKISIVFEQHLGKPLSDEEKMYLMLHINRLCTREQSDQ